MGSSVSKRTDEFHMREEEIVFIIPDGPGLYTAYCFGERDSPDYPYALTMWTTHGVKPEHERYLVNRAELPEHLKQDLHVVVSTKSGTCQAEQFYDQVLKTLLQARGLFHRKEEADASNKNPEAGQKGTYKLFVTSHSGSVRGFAKTALSTDKPTCVILLSGDGGVVDLLNNNPRAGAKAPSDTPSSTPIISLLPLGTGNALFHSIHKSLYSQPPPLPPNRDPQPPKPLLLALRTLFTGTPHRLPAFQATFSPGARLVPAPTGDDAPDGEAAAQEGSYTPYRPVPSSRLLGTIVASYALHASLVHESDTPALRKHGRQRFGMAAAELSKAAHAYQARVVYRAAAAAAAAPPAAGEWTALDRAEHGYLLAAHVSNLEKTFCISPASGVLDGRMWLVHFAPMRGEEVMAVMGAAYEAGGHVQMAEVGYLGVEGVRVEVMEEEERWRKLCVDGTIVEVEKGGWMEVRTGVESGLRVLVPRGVAGGGDDGTTRSRL